MRKKFLFQIVVIIIIFIQQILFIGNGYSITKIANVINGQVPITDTFAKKNYIINVLIIPLAKQCFNYCVQSDGSVMRWVPTLFSFSQIIHPPFDL